LRSIALSVLAASIASTAGAADGPSVLAAQGRVLVVHQGGKPVQAAQGQTLQYGDEIRTLKASLAQIGFPDGATILIKENSAFLIAGTPRRTLLSFSIGEFLIGLKRRLAGNETFRVRTPAAVAAVRGTLFWGLSDQNNDAAFASLDNEIVVTAQGRSITLKPGQKTNIPFGKPPQAPQAASIPPSFLGTFAIGGSIQGLDGLLKK
jgi:ferric-dicitrate binding protein FerR (iron transport regulator)